MKVLFYRLFTISWLAAPMSALAAAIPTYPPGGRSFADSNTLFTQIANTAGTIVMGLAVIMIMYAAFLFLTAGGVPDNLTKARNTLIFALVGVAVALLAFAAPTIILAILPGA